MALYKFALYLYLYFVILAEIADDASLSRSLNVGYFLEIYDSSGHCYVARSPFLQ